MLVKIKYICVACGPIISGPTTLLLVDWGFYDYVPTSDLATYISCDIFSNWKKKKKLKLIFLYK